MATVDTPTNRTDPTEYFLNIEEHLNADLQLAIARASLIYGAIESNEEAIIKNNLADIANSLVNVLTEVKEKIYTEIRSGLQLQPRIN